MTDEEVIKRRLLIDGDGTGDDRRLNVLQKSLIKFCNTEESPENIQLSLGKMLMQLSQCEYTVKKSRQVASMSATELKNYESLSKKIKTEIEEQKKIISNTKVDLQEAKTIRKNKMEYDLLGKVIEEQPDRKETGRKLEKLKKDLGALKETRDKLDQKMTSRRQQFNVLLVTINQLQKTLEDDDINSADIASNDKDEDMIVIHDTIEISK